MYGEESLYEQLFISNRNHSKMEIAIIFVESLDYYLDMHVGIQIYLYSMRQFQKFFFYLK